MTNIDVTSAIIPINTDTDTSLTLIENDTLVTGSCEYVCFGNVFVQFTNWRGGLFVDIAVASLVVSVSLGHSCTFGSIRPSQMIPVALCKYAKCENLTLNLAARKDKSLPGLL